MTRSVDVSMEAYRIKCLENKRLAEDIISLKEQLEDKKDYIRRLETMLFLKKLDSFEKKSLERFSKDERKIK